MKFKLMQIDDKLSGAIVECLRALGHETGAEGIELRCLSGEAGSLTAAFDGKTARLTAAEPVLYLRALHLLLQKLECCGQQAFLESERARFGARGVLLDCARNGSLRPDRLKLMLRQCAALGLNEVYLYLEDMYELPEEPYFGAFRGRFSQAELRELDAYADSLGVSLIPAIQTLAHLHSFLRWPKTLPLQDTEDILLVGGAETEQLVRGMIRAAAAPFRSKKLHLGMDEAEFLGLGKYLQQHGYRERYQLMSEQLELVCRVCREEGLEPMIWSDMFFKLASPSGQYYDLAPDADFQLPIELPAELCLVYWDYYHHERAVYEKNLSLHRKLSERLCFAGGGWTWNGVAPNYQKAQKTLSEGLAACAAQGVEQVMCTFWFDNGTETPFATWLYSAAVFAELCFVREAAEEKSSDKKLEPAVIDGWLELLCGCNVQDFMLLDALDAPEGILPENENADNPSKWLLYQDVLLGLFDGQIEGMQPGAHYAALEAKLADCLKRRGDKPAFAAQLAQVFEFYRCLAELLAQKAELGLALRAAYHQADRDAMTDCRHRIRDCAGLCAALRAARETVWFSECRPFGWEVLDIRFSGLEARLESAARRVELWLDGCADRLDELEQPVLPYDVDKARPKHRLCRANLWQNIISAGNISGV